MLIARLSRSPGLNFFGLVTFINKSIVEFYEAVLNIWTFDYIHKKFGKYNNFLYERYALKK